MQSTTPLAVTAAPPPGHAYRLSRITTRRLRSARYFHLQQLRRQWTARNVLVDQTLRRRSVMQATDRQNAAEQQLGQESEPFMPQTSDPADKSGNRKQSMLGPLSLFGCALLWGTSAPAMRYLYLQGPGQAPRPSLICAVQTSGAALCLVLLDAASRRWDKSADSNDSLHEAPSRPAVSPGAASEPASSAWPLSRLLTATKTHVSAAGFEVGLWAFVANCLTVTGFENTTTTRGTFLIRLSAMFTPIVAALVGEKVTLPIWLGCSAAFAGGILISADSSSSQADASAFLNLSSGDMLIIIAAVLWSVQTVRMGKHAPKFPPIKLAKFQLATMSFFSALWLGRDAVFAFTSGARLESLWGGYDQPLNWGVLLIPAIGPWSVGVALQAKGQSSVASSLAMIIFATDPLWATLFAGLVGGNEQHLGLLGWVGAVAILSASVIASFGKR